MRPLLLTILLGLLCTSVTAVAKSRLAGNHPYVTCLGGVFYARAIPAEERGTKGTTTIYRVRKEQDEVVVRHDWFASDALHLGWSPIAGKVAALAVDRETDKDPVKQVELRFYLGADHLATYTTADLQKMGAQLGRPWADEGASRRADARVVGCEQIANTNDYVFRIVLRTATGERTVDFDILTGKPYDAAQATTRPGHK